MTTDAQLLRAAAYRLQGVPCALRPVRRADVPLLPARGAGTADAAHDLTAETFAQAWLCRARFEDVAGGSAGPWLFGIARNVLSTSVRRRRLERSASSRLGILERLDREPAAVEPEETWVDGLDKALAELPETQLDALRLRFVEDLSVRRARGCSRHDLAGCARPRPPRPPDTPYPPRFLEGEHSMTDLQHDSRPTRRRSRGRSFRRPLRPAARRRVGGESPPASRSL